MFALGDTDEPAHERFLVAWGCREPGLGDRVNTQLGAGLTKWNRANEDTTLGNEGGEEHANGQSGIGASWECTGG